MGCTRRSWRRVVEEKGGTGEREWGRSASRPSNEKEVQDVRRMLEDSNKSDPTRSTTTYVWSNIRNVTN